MTQSAEGRFIYTVFTKAWRMPIPELGEYVARLGFDGIELPIRPGYQVEPERIDALPAAARELERHGVRIYSIAGPVDERTIAACAEAGVPTIRIMAAVGPDGYLAAEARWHKEFDALLPRLEKHGVQIGVQNHCARNVANANGLRQLIGKYDPRYIAAIWDAAHEVLCGVEPEYAIELVWSHLCMVNLKNVFWVRQNEPQAREAAWDVIWTIGRQGLASWPRVMTELKRRGFRGVLCLTAQYNDGGDLEQAIADDLAFARELAR